MCPLHDNEPPSCQRGAVLLVALTPLLLVSLFWLLGMVNGLAKDRAMRVFESAVALGQAKRALLGWAAGHEVVPGMMPWPDRNGDGNYDGNSDCVTSGPPVPRFLLGRLPWFAQTAPCAGPRSGLSIQVRDAAKEPLWYAVSRNLVRSYNPPQDPLVNPALVNVAPFDWLTVRDSTGAVISDRVAVVILAPGPPLATQNRTGRAPGAGEFLDSVTIAGTRYSNADHDEDFIAFTDAGNAASRAESFNDQLLFITVDELLDSVEKRVIGEVARALRGYARASWNPGGAYPWSSVFEDPSTKDDFAGDVGVGAGFLGLHKPGESFDTAFEVAWEIPDGLVIRQPPTDLTPTDGLIGPISRVAKVGSRCVWSDRRSATCRGSTVPEMVLGSGAELIERRYSFDVTLRLPDDSEPAVTPPSGSGVRRRALAYERGASFSLDIRVDDRQLSPPGPSGTSRLLVSDPTVGQLQVSGIRYELGVGPRDELAPWFTQNDWQRFIYASASPDLQPPGLSSCQPGLTCLALSNWPAAADDKAALVLSMGGKLQSQTRPSNRLSDYLEGDNANHDLVFERRAPSGDFNDQIRIVAP